MPNLTALFKNKPIKSTAKPLNFSAFQPKTTQTSSIWSNPFTEKQKEKREGLKPTIAPLNMRAFQPKTSFLPKPEIKPFLEEYQVPERTPVARQDFKDVANLFVELATIIPVAISSTVQTIREAKAGKALEKYEIPLFKEQKLVAQGVQRNYEDRLKAGQSARKAFIYSSLEMGLDLAFTIGSLKSVARKSLLKTPEALTKRTVIADTQAVRNYVSGRSPYLGVEVPQELKTVWSKLPSSKKKDVLKGLIQLEKVEPNRLAKILGVSEAEIKMLVPSERIIAPTRRLPGYAPEGRPAFGLSIEPRKPVGFGKDKFKKVETFLREKGISDTKSTNIAEKMQKLITGKSKTIEGDIRFLADTINANTRLAFQEVTGIKLDRTQKKAQQQIRDLIGKEKPKAEWLTKGEVKKAVEELKDKKVVVTLNKRGWQKGQKRYPIKPTLWDKIYLEGDILVRVSGGNEWSSHIDNVRDIIVDGKSMIGDLESEKYAKNLFKKPKTLITKPTSTKSPLIAEARKYETAEEFVKAQPKVYHGTLTKDAEKIAIQGFRGRKELGKITPYADDVFFGDVTYITNNKKQAQAFAEQMGTKRGVSTFQGKETSVLDLVLDKNIKLAKQPKANTTKQYKKLVDELKKNYDGLDLPGGIKVIWNKNTIKTKPQLKQIWEEARGVKKIDAKMDVRVPTVGITPTKVQQLPRKRLLEPALGRVPLRVDVSLKKKLPQPELLVKTFTKDGRVLIDSKGKVIFPKPTKTKATPLESPVILEAKAGIRKEKELRIAEKALENVKNKHGHTEIIIENLKKKGVSQEDINNIILENGDRLVDTVKIKREANGVLSATIRKDTLKEMEANFAGTDLTKKWIPTKTAMQKLREAGKTVKETPLEYYELPQIFFDRTGLRKQFYDPIRDAERNAQDMKTAIFKQFDKADLMKKGGWFTAERFNLTTKEAENIGEYFLTRQEKGGKIKLSDLTTKEKKFVEVFDNVIKESEERFYRVAKLNGKSPGKVENYAPIMTSKDYKLAQEIGDMEFIFRKHPAFFSLKQREIKVPFNMYELDYRKVASRWIDQMANFNHLGEVGVQTKYLANSDEFRNIVGSKVFNTTNKWLQNKFNPQVLSTMEKGGRFFRQKTAIASLGLNFASVIKQTLTQVPLTIIEKAPPKLRSKFAKDFGIKVSDLASLKERKGNVAIMDMQQGFNKAFVGPLAEFDKFNAQISLNRLLDKNYKKVLKEGKEVSPEIQAQIIKQAQDILDMWYGGMTSAQLPVAFRTELGKLLNMFIYPLTSQLNGFFYSVAKAKGFNKAEKFAEVLASALIIAYMEQVITNLSPKWSDTKEMVIDTFSSLAGNIPIISQVVFAIRTDQPLSPSPIFSSLGRMMQQTSKSMKDQADAGDVIFAFMELFGMPKQVRRATDGAVIVKEGGLRDKNGKLLVPVKGEWEYIRAFLRGKYGTIATQDWIRNIGIPKEKRMWFVPEVEFFQNGDYDRKEELYKSFDKETQDELYAELSEGQQKKLDKALRTPPKTLEHKKRLFREKIKKALEDGTMSQKEAVEKTKKFKEAVEKLK